jgi:hypothetical protein
MTAVSPTENPVKTLPIRPVLIIDPEGAGRIEFYEADIETQGFELMPGIVPKAVFNMKAHESQIFLFCTVNSVGHDGLRTWLFDFHPREHPRQQIEMAEGFVPIHISLQLIQATWERKAFLVPQHIRPDHMFDRCLAMNCKVIIVKESFGTFLRVESPLLKYPVSYTLNDFAKRKIGIQ